MNKPLLARLALIPALLGSLPAGAQIVADPSAPATQRPTVLNAANGVPQVNIQTPSAAGVSRNTYSQFDVQSQGAILNNARNNTQTQLGGWVQGNPWLAAGTAKVILNEVNSSNPSLLKGYVEVAGDRAQVVIANPSGISCDGCGFINANRATLTTGTPIMNGGSLDGYRVQGGTVTVSGAGLDASHTDYTDIIARAVQINAGIWANVLNVTTGANQVDAGNTQATPIAGSGAAPAFALDVSALGGMYAGKITLIGTEAGVGVRNAGQIGASAGDVVVTLDGRLVNSGSLTSSGNTQIAASGGATNSGTIYAQGDLSLQTGADIANSGLLAAQGNTALTATGANGQISSSAAGILGAGILADGTVSGAGSLAISASQSVSIQGQAVSGGDQSIAAASLDLSGSRISAPNLTLAAAMGNIDTSNAVVSAAGILSISANANAGQWLVNDGGTLSANQLSLLVANLSNRQGTLQQSGTGDTSLAMISGSTPGLLDNTLGLIATNGADLSLSAAQIVNTQGQIQHNGSGWLAVDAGSFSGSQGSLLSAGSLNMSVTGVALLDGAATQAAQLSLAADSVSHVGGRMIQTGSGPMALTAAQSFDNTGGVIAANGDVTLTANSLTNQGGTIQAAGTGGLTVGTTALLDNSAAGLLAANGAMNLTAGQLDNSSGQIAAGQSLTALVAGAVRNVGGVMVGNGDVALNAATLDNTTGIVAAAAGSLTVTTSGVADNTAGQLEALGDVALANTGLTNDGGTVAGRNVTIGTSQHALSNRGGAVVATGTLAVDSGALNNDAGLIQSGAAMTIDTHGQALTNTNAGSQGGILGQSTLTLTAGALDNTAGFIGAQGALSITGTTLTNTGQIASASDVGIDVATFDNAGGQTVVGGNLSVDTGSGTADNTGGLLRANGALTLSAARIVNRQTSGANQGIEGQSVGITAAQIDNTQGAMRASQGLTLASAGSLDNTNGLLSSSLDLMLQDPSAIIGQNAPGKTLSITNTGGTMITGRSLAIDSAYLSGDGAILSLGDIDIQVLRDYLHTGQMQANGALSFETAGTLTNQSTFQAGTTLSLKAATLDNQAGGQLQGTQLNLQATDTHTFTNRGLINGSDTFIDAVTLNNLGTGRIYGDHVALSATTLNNLPENGVAPVIAARTRLDIGATTVNNFDGAMIYSAGDMAFGGSLDANHVATGQGGTLTNSSATIAADGNLSLAFNQVLNQRTSFSVSQQTDGGQAQYVLLEWRCGGPWGLILAQWVTHTDTVVNADSGAATISAGGNLSFNGAVTNDKSTIQAGSSIALDQARYIGIGQQGQTLSSSIGVTYYCTGCAVGGYGAVVGGYYVLGDPYQVPGIDAGAQARVASTVNSLKSNITPQMLQQWSVTGVPSDIGYTTVQTGWDDYGNPVYISVPPFDGVYSPYSSGNVGTATYNLAPAVLSANQSITGTATQIANLNLVGTGRTASSPTAASPNLIAPVAASNVRPVSSVAATTGTAGTVIRSVAPNTHIPNNALYKINASPGSHYLVETDPAFANYQTWLSSDYLLTALGVDPATTQKRLGDGFYEQQLVQDQVSQLTGRRFLPGYSDGQTEYQALMDAGATFAQAQHLTPGVALTPAQVAQLTSDIVWLVQQTVTLPDGTTTTALVPQVYVRVQPGDVDSNGSLIAADTIKLQVSGDLTNNGSIAGRQVLSLTADNLSNLGGRMSGNTVSLQALTDLNNLAGEIRAGDSLTIQAGRDLNVASTTTDFHEASGTIFTHDATSLNRIAGLYVSNPGGTLLASAGRDMTLTAATIDSAGSMILAAGNNLNLATLATSDSRSVTAPEAYSQRAQTSEAGTSITAKNDVALSAGTDLTARAANVASDGAVSLAAGRDIAIVAGQATSESVESSTDARSGSFRKDVQYATTALGSVVVAGSNLTVASGRDTVIQGSALAANRDVGIQTGGDLQLLAAAETNYRSVQSHQRTRHTVEDLNFELNETRALLSTITAGGNATIQVGGNVVADTGTKDAQGNLQADRMTANGVVQGVERQQVTQSGNASSAGESKVLGNLAAQGIRSGASDSFAAGATLSGQAAVEALMQSGLVSLRNDPGIQSILAAPSPSGNAMTYTDASGRVQLTVAGQAKVQEVYSALRLNESFDVQHIADQGLAQAVTLAAAIALTVMSGGAGAAMIGAAEGTTEALVANATFTSMTSTMVGQLAGGASLGDAFQAGFKAGLTSGATAGILNTPMIDTGNGMQSINQWAGIQDVAGTGAKVANGFATGNWSNLGQTVAGIGLRAGISAGISTAVYGGSFGQAFTNSVVGDAAAIGANVVGQQQDLSLGTRALAHAAIGAVAAQLTGKDALSGAIGGAGATLINPLLDNAIGGPDGSGWTDPNVRSGVLQAGSMIGSALVANAVGGSGMTAAMAAQNETVNNYLSNWQKIARDREKAACASVFCKIGVEVKYAGTSVRQDANLVAGMALGAGLTAGEMIAVLPQIPAMVSAVLNDPNLLAKLPEGYAQQVQDTYARYATALETAGSDGATAAGVEFTRLVTLLAPAMGTGTAAVSTADKTLTVLQKTIASAGKTDGIVVAGSANSSAIPLVTSEGTANAATAPKLADALAATMSKPTVSDSKLASLMDDLYRDGATVGTGSTADAVRYETATGDSVGGVFHTQKAQDYAAALQRWLDANPSAPFADRSAAQNVLRDITNALQGK